MFHCKSSVTPIVVALIVLVTGCSPKQNVSPKPSSHTTTLYQHKDITPAAVFSPSNSLLAVALAGTEKGKVRIWDSATKKLLKTLPIDSPWLWVMAFSPDGNYLAGGGMRGDVYLWDISTGKRLWKKQHGDVISQLAYSPNGKWLVSAASFLKSSSGQAALHLWEASSGKLAGTASLSGVLRALQFTSEKTLLVGCSKPQRLTEIWEAIIVQTLEKPKLLHAFKTDKAFTKITIAPSGKMMAAGGRHGNITIWHLNHKPLKAQPFRGHKVTTTLAFSPDEEQLVYGTLADEEVSLQLWDIKKNKQNAAIEGQYLFSSASFSHTGETIGFLQGRAVKMWKPSTFSP